MLYSREASARQIKLPYSHYHAALSYMMITNAGRIFLVHPASYITPEFMKLHALTGDHHFSKLVRSNSCIISPIKIKSRHPLYKWENFRTKANEASGLSLLQQKGDIE